MILSLFYMMHQLNEVLFFSILRKVSLQLFCFAQETYPDAGS